MEGFVFLVYIEKHRKLTSYMQFSLNWWKRKRLKFELSLEEKTNKKRQLHEKKSSDLLCCFSLTGNTTALNCSWGSFFLSKQHSLSRSLPLTSAALIKKNIIIYNLQTIFSAVIIQSVYNTSPINIDFSPALKLDTERHRFKGENKNKKELPNLKKQIPITRNHSYKRFLEILYETRENRNEWQNLVGMRPIFWSEISENCLYFWAR